MKKIKIEKIRKNEKKMKKIKKIKKGKKMKKRQKLKKRQNVTRWIKGGVSELVLHRSIKRLRGLCTMHDARRRGGGGGG